MSVDTMLRKEKDGTLYKHTKLSSDLSEARDKTVDAIADAATRSKVVRLGEDLKALAKKMGVPEHKPTSIKDRLRRLLERRGDLQKTAEPPPPPGVSLEKWDGFLATGRDWGRRLKKKEAGKYGKNSAGFDLQGKTEVQGLPIAVENRKGSVREGENDDGSKWRTKFRTPYGYIEGTKGADGDEVDAYVGPNKDAPKAFVVHQKKDDGSHDEDTVMLGYKSKGEAKKDILRHYDDKSQVGGVDEMTVEMLRARLARADGKKVEKLSAAIGSDQASLNYRDGDPPHMTGLPARKRRKKGEVPSREMHDPYPPPKAENRQESQGTKLVGGFAAAEGYDDVGKVAEALGKDRALGDQPKKWEGPTRDSVGKAMPEKHRLRTATGSERVELEDISSAVGQDEGKTASLIQDVGRRVVKVPVKQKAQEKIGSTADTGSELGAALVKLNGRGLPRRRQAEDNRVEPFSAGRGTAIEALGTGAAPTDGYSKTAMVEELGALGALTVAQLEKLAAEVTTTEAAQSLKRLKKLEKEKPTVGQIGRGAAVGAGVMPLAGLAWRAVAGPKGRAPLPKQIWPGARPMAATAAQGGVLGGLMPAGQQKLEREVEKQRLREYVGDRRRGTLRGKIKKTVGV